MKKKLETEFFAELRKCFPRLPGDTPDVWLERSMASIQEGGIKALPPKLKELLLRALRPALK